MFRLHHCGNYRHPNVIQETWHISRLFLITFNHKVYACFHHTVSTNNPFYTQPRHLKQFRPDTAQHLKRPAPVISFIGLFRSIGRILSDDMFEILRSFAYITIANKEAAVLFIENKTKHNKKFLIISR